MIYQENEFDIDFRSVKRPRRLGLLSGMTGVPVFLIFLKDINRAQNYFFTSFEEMHYHINQSDNEWNREAWESIIPFFESGGKVALVMASPLDEAAFESEGELLSQFIGNDRSYVNKTGIYLLRSLTDQADIISIPQACSKLSVDSLQIFHQQLLTFLEEVTNFFFLADLPLTFKKEQYIEWAKKINSSNASLYYPWLIKDNICSAPSVIAASIIQNNDTAQGISDSIANRKLDIPWKPMLIEMPGTLNELQNSKINVFHLFSENNCRIWGDNTLSSDSERSNRLASNRRALKAIEKAISSICETYVLEPLTNRTEMKVEMDIIGFCNKMKHLFDPMAKDPYNIKVTIDRQRSEEIIDIKCSFKLPNSLEKTPLFLNVSG